jgi:hypothetical protein
MASAAPLAITLAWQPDPAALHRGNRRWRRVEQYGPDHPVARAPAILAFLRNQGERAGAAPYRRALEIDEKAPETRPSPARIWRTPSYCRRWAVSLTGAPREHKDASIGT